MSPRRPVRHPLLLAVALACACTGAHAADDVDKVNGSISADAGQTYGDLSTVNGGVTIGAGAHVGSASTVNGSIEAGDALVADSINTVNGGIRVGSHAQISGDMETVNGGIFVDRGGRIGKGVGTVNGAIGLVDTEVAGDVETVSGDITIGVGSQVRGALRVRKPNASWLPINFGNKRKPRIIIGPNAAVDGELVFERDVTLYVHKSARIGKVVGATPIAYDGARAPTE